MGKTLDAVNTTISEAVARGIVDERLHAAPISVMRSIAATIDDPGFPIINDRYDNVSIPTLLKYLQSLGLTVQEIKPAKMAEQKKKTKLDKARERRFHAVS